MLGASGDGRLRLLDVGSPARWAALRLRRAEGAEPPVAQLQPLPPLPAPFLCLRERLQASA